MDISAGSVWIEVTLLMHVASEIQPRWQKKSIQYIYAHADQKRCDNVSYSINEISFHVILNIQHVDVKRAAGKFPHRASPSLT